MKSEWVCIGHLRFKMCSLIGYSHLRSGVRLIIDECGQSKIYEINSLHNEDHVDKLDKLTGLKD